MIEEGGCYCGALRYEVSGDPVVKALCFCRICQRIAGGGPAVIMGVPEAAFRYLAGTPSSFVHPDVEAASRREFCVTCGTHVASRTPAAPGVVIVRVGTLDHPAVFGLPQFATYVADLQPFHAIPQGVAQFQAFPVRNAGS